jgi:hypothetical protein
VTAASSTTGVSVFSFLLLRLGQMKQVIVKKLCVVANGIADTTRCCLYLFELCLSNILVTVWRRSKLADFQPLVNKLLGGVSIVPCHTQEGGFFLFAPFRASLLPATFMLLSSPHQCSQPAHGCAAEPQSPVAWFVELLISGC